MRKHTVVVAAPGRRSARSPRNRRSHRRTIRAVTAPNAPGARSTPGASGYDRLSALDETFLHLERPETPMHVGAIAVLERAPFYGPTAASGSTRCARWCARGCQLIPRFRRGSMPMPFGLGRPMWVDDAHLRHRRPRAAHPRSPRRGQRRQLIELAERLMEQVLDRDRPLWELWFVEGVDGGEHVGLMHKSHHTLTDGISGIDIATVAARLHRRSRPCSNPTAWQPEPPPEPARLVVDAVRDRLRQPAELVGLARRGMSAPREVVDRAAHLARSIGSLVGADPIAPTLSINAPDGARSPDRGRARRSSGPVRMVRRAFGCTVNDVVLAGVGGALRARARRAWRAPPRPHGQVFCPVSVRDDERAHAAREPHLGDVRAARRR